MDKQKQIEEMAKDIYEQKSCNTSFEENCKLLAYDLVTLGYQKVDKDSVVLTMSEHAKLVGKVRQEFEYEYKDKVVLSMEEFEKINFYKELYEETYMREQKLNEFNSNLIIDNQTLKDKLELKGKETAREIFKALYSMRDVYAEHYEYEIRLNEYNLQELAKQYSVEIEE